MYGRINLEEISKEDLVKIILEKDDELKNKDEEIEDLKKELFKYKNSNTPPSANKHIKPNTQGQQAKPNGKRGAPKGHKGTTREQKPDRKEIIDTDECPFCGSHNIEDEEIITKITEEIPEPVVPEVVENEIHKKHCNNCDTSFIPPKSNVPLKGKFGINLMVLVIFIRFILRGVLRKTARFLGTGFAFRITPASVNAIVKRVADAAEKEYEELKVKIRNTIKVYVDETSFSVLGKNWWVWVFRTEDAVLLVIRPSRGKDVLKEILGELYSGTVICDCWRAYNFLSCFANLQRCWSHLLRKSKELCQTVAGKHLHEKLKALFKEIKAFNEMNPTKEQRMKKYEGMTAQLKKIVAYYSKYQELQKVIKYIDNNVENWFTCIKIEGIEPTNNFAEHAIRETVMVRKIIGAFRSETGTQHYEKLASLLSTWQIQELDIKAQLKQMLIKNLCFC